MSIAAMSLIIAAILSLTDVLSHTKRVLGLSGMGCVYFVVCILALSLFDVSIVTEMTINAGCAAVLLAVCSMFACGTQKRKLLIVPAALLFAAIGNVIDGISPNLGIYAVSAAYLVLLIKRTERSAFAVAAVAPVFGELIAFIVEYAITGYSDIELNGAVLDKQCFGLLTLALGIELKYALSQAMARKRSAKETR